MGVSERIDIDSVDFTMEVGIPIDSEHLEWVPDAARFILRIHEADGEVIEYPHSWTCLEHVFLLLDRLETRESGHILWGTNIAEIRFRDDQVTLFRNPSLTGTVDEIRSVTENLAKQMFEYMRQHHGDSRDIAENIANSRFAPWEFDPVEVHDRLLD